MMGIKDNKERTQIEFTSLEDLVPQNHLVRKLDAAFDFSFIYDCVKDLYEPYGRESIDSVVLVKITLIQYLFKRIFHRVLLEAYPFGFIDEEKSPHPIKKYLFWLYFQTKKETNLLRSVCFVSSLSTV